MKRRFENNTLLTPSTSLNETNVHAGQNDEIGEGFSNTPVWGPLPDDFGVRRVRPIVDDLLSWLGVQIRNEEEWEDGLRATLDELTDEGLLHFWDRRLQIEIRDYDCSLVWAFPLNQQAWIADYFQIKPQTQIMLMISAERVEQRPTALYQRLLRHSLGHILWALRNSTWCYECHRSAREFSKWRR